MNALEGREFLIASILLAGNGYARIEHDGRGSVSALWPLNPSSVSVERLESGRLRYKYRPPQGPTQVILQDEMLHLRYRTHDGMMGISPVGLARETLGIAAHQMRSESDFF